MMGMNKENQVKDREGEGSLSSGYRCLAQHLYVTPLPVTLQDEMPHKVFVIILDIIARAIDVLTVVRLLGDGAGCRDAQHSTGAVDVVTINVPLMTDQPPDDVSVHLFKPPPSPRPTSLTRLLHRQPLGGRR